MFPLSGTHALLWVPNVLILCILESLTYIHCFYPLVECSLFVLHPKCHLVIEELLVIITSTWIWHPISWAHPSFVKIFFLGIRSTLSRMLIYGSASLYYS